jgi:Transposase DDE domain group 1
LRVQATKPPARFEVTCDGDGIAGHAGSALLVELADRLGLTTALGWRAGRTQTSRHRYGAGQVLRDLAVLLADGGDCLSDLAALRDQPELFGPVASTPTAWRVIEQVARDLDGLAGLRAARAHARAAAWRAGAHSDGLLVIDVDGTLLDAHSDKQGAAGTYKGGFGFYPLLAYLDRGDGTGEALAGILRPGNAGSNTTADHIEVIDLALAQLPTAAHDQPRLVRADSGGATHAFTSHLRERGVRFSVSLPADERVRAAVLAVAADAWQPAASRAQAPRSPNCTPSSSPAGRRGPGRSADARIPTPACSCASPTPTGTASRCSSPTSPTPTSPPWSCRIAAAPASRTASAAARPPGCATSPCRWIATIGLGGTEPIVAKTLRRRPLHLPGRLTRSARRRLLHLPTDWPWAAQFLHALARLRALPAPG